MIGRFLSALQFLTVISVQRESASLGKTAVFFPLIGAMLGACTGAVMWIVSIGLGRSLGALIGLAWLLATTGCLHEDGLADVADAVRAGRSREKMTEVLKDSRIGTYGAIALIVSIALRWQSMAQLKANPVAGLAVALAFSRTSLVAAAVLSPAVGTGMGQAFAASCSRPVFLAALTQLIAIAGLMGVFVGQVSTASMIASGVILVLLSRSYFTRRLGGLNGDCLGATCQAVEVVNLVILAWHPSI